MASSPPAAAFRIGENVHPMLREILLARGWKESKRGEEWNLHWKHSRFSTQQSTSVHSRQLLNHFQKTSTLSKKDMLARNLRRMRNVYGRVYDFYPVTYILPRERELMLRDHKTSSTPKQPTIWIVKPCASSRGRDIFLLSDPERHQLLNSSCIVQKYLHEPMLISGYKFDLRLYVLVKSFHPLHVFLYRKGLARFGTQKYSSDVDTLDNLFSHLTNSSLNRFSPTIATKKGSVGTGCKLTLEQLFPLISTSTGFSESRLRQRIKNIINLTLLSVASDIPVNKNCFELFGFDILLDRAGKPWLLEVNGSPALAISCEEDQSVKIPMINDMLDRIGLDSADANSFDFSTPPSPSSPAAGEADNEFEQIFPFNETTAFAVEQLLASEVGNRNLAAANQHFQKTSVHEIQVDNRRGVMTSSTGNATG